MSLLAYLIFGLAAAMMLGWRRGVRTNQQLLLETCAATERVFQPTDTSYTNIGGLVGYNFAYQLDSAAFHRLDGTITTLPRQSLLYYPIARFMGREDNLILTLFCYSLAPGEGHIVEERQFGRGWIPIDDDTSMRSETVEHGELRFLLFSYNPLVRSLLLSILARLSGGPSLRYIGYYGSNGYISLRFCPGSAELETQINELHGVLADCVASRL
ncbi:MAG: hypothetical protein EA404_03215 [Spirochaetaceae bacterium]|nr:MAG: hypothetical protein EA404_03215 [Spirochaetaceae bacterium]